MNKKISIFLLAAFSIIQSGCNNSRFDYLDRTGYYLDHFDINRVRIRKEGVNKSIDAVPPQVTEIYNPQSGVYIVKQMIILDFDCVDQFGLSSLRSVATGKSRYWLISQGNQPVIVAHEEISNRYPKYNLTNPIRTFPYVPDDGREMALIKRMKTCNPI